MRNHDSDSMMHIPIQILNSLTAPICNAAQCSISIPCKSTHTFRTFTCLNQTTRKEKQEPSSSIPYHAMSCHAYAYAMLCRICPVTPPSRVKPRCKTHIANPCRPVADGFRFLDPSLLPPRERQRRFRFLVFSFRFFLIPWID